MTAPKTLLEISGADLTPSPLSASTVVLIDCQMEYLDGKLPLPDCAPALDEVARLLARARAAGTPIVHIAHKGQPGGAFDRDGHGGRIADKAAPEGDEKVIEKGLPNAFAGTTLEDELKRIGRGQIVFAGFMTHMCVSSSARAALDLGFRSTVIADAVATRDLPLPDGGSIDARQLHGASLAELADRFAIVAKTTSDLPD